jgi:dethiobiotin synthetase
LVRDLLVTGTDTGVGKTLVACALLAALRRRGVRAIGFKPVETGNQPGEKSDSERLAAASGESNPLAMPLLQLSEPLAPAVAAERAGLTLEREGIESRIAKFRDAGYTLIVEGAGGVMVPFAWNYSVLDLARAARLDAVVVGRAGLGTLNHVALTAMALADRGIELRAIVLNGRRTPPDLAETTNPGALHRLVPGVPIFEVPQAVSFETALQSASRVLENLL